MKKLFSLLFALGALLALPVHAQTTVRVFVVIDQSAAYVITNVRNTSISSWVQSEVIARTNQIFTSSSTPVTMQLAGTASGPATNPPPGTLGWGDTAWIRNSIPIQEGRDSNNASITLYVSAFDASTDPYSTRSGCNSSGGSPQNAVAGVSVNAQTGGRDMIAVAIGTALCMNPVGYTYKQGTNSTNCEAALTVEATNIAYPGGVPITTQNACWKTNTATCYADGPTAIGAVPGANPSLQNCSFSNGQMIGGAWNETVTCNGGSYAQNWAATIQGTYPNTFYCQNVTRLSRFSNPSVLYKGVPMGDSTYNNAAVIGTQATQTAGYNTTKIAPKLKAAALSAASAAQN